MVSAIYVFTGDRTTYVYLPQRGLPNGAALAEWVFRYLHEYYYLFTL